MTGLLDRLRAWFGSGDGDDGDAATDDESGDVDGSAAANSRVVHRDDRPLETPDTLPGPKDANASTPAETSGSSSSPVGGPAAASGEDSASDPGRVSIPDAAAVAGDPAASAPTKGEKSRAGAADGSDGTGIPARAAWTAADATTGDDRRDGTDAEAEATATAADDEADAFACSVCGTSVDDPTGPCPLCRSTDVVPASDASSPAGEPTASGRTAVSAGEEDDEAVDRLRDVKGEER